MEPLIDASFFHQCLKELKVLVIVPHEDDEINLCGALLKTFSDCGASIFLAYTTNGDWKYPAQVRFQEAVNSAKFFGIPESNIVFMGYGDAINNDKKDHLFYYEDAITKSSSGHTETYGTHQYQDFAYKMEQKHHVYTNRNYLKDLISVIQWAHADLIICTDFDEHPDHRMLSIFFDKAIGIIKKEEPEYRPEIWKSFAYALAYTAVSDYSVVNNPETKRPCVGITDKYQWDIIDKFIYRWNNRIRIPVPPEARSNSIKNNIISKALMQHKSQCIITKADSIINSDTVFWKRRTDSISYSANISVSSGQGEYLNDYMIYNVCNVDEPTPEFVDYYWQPDKEDSEKVVMFSWKKPVNIEKVCLYGVVTEKGKIEKLLISFSDGFQKVIKNLSQNGSPTEILVGKRTNITCCELKILEATGEIYGLSECEFYSVANNKSCINPFCKIMVNDNFVYEYIFEEKTKSISFDCYYYGLTGNISIRVEKGKSVFNKGRLLIDEADKEIIIKAQNENGDIWDRIIVRRFSEEEIDRLREIDLSNKQYLRKKRREKKFHNMLFILKHEGIWAVIKRTFNNVIKPNLLMK